MSFSILQTLKNNINFSPTIGKGAITMDFENNESMEQPEAIESVDSFDDDVILPDDYGQEEQSEQFETVDTEEDTKPTEETESYEPVTEEPQKIKIKYNHEEREIPVDEAQALVQKGMNYEKAVERARQEAKDAFIAEQGYVWNGNPITTEADYKNALQEQELMQKYQNQNLPEEVISELIEGRKFREQLQSETKTKQEEEKANADFQEFFGFFREANGRDYNPNNDKIPDQVWQTVSKGVPLKYAYMEHQNQELQGQVKVLKQNKQNEDKAPVQGITTHGSQETAIEDDFLRGFDSI